MSFFLVLWDKLDRYEMLKGTERQREREKGKKGATTMKRRRTE